jgi:hypothetical protein
MNAQMPTTVPQVVAAASSAPQNAATDSVRCYRVKEKTRILTALETDSSLLVVSAPGLGKSALANFVADELRRAGGTVAFLTPTTQKQTLLSLAMQIGAPLHRDDGKQFTATQLQDEIAATLQAQPAFIIIDDAHRLPLGLRMWIDSLLEARQRLLLLATYPPRRDIFLKLPRIELQPLDPQPIRALMQHAAHDLNLHLSPAQLSALAERCGGNPMLAARVVREEYLGLDDTAPDHAQWIDGTSLLVAGLMIFAALRYIGRGLNSTDLYLFGGVLAVAVGIVRLLVYSLPRQKARLGQ